MNGWLFLLGFTLALQLLPYRLKPSFPFKQYWHERYHHDSANRWMREVCAGFVYDEF